VLSLPGTGRLRLRADESGYDNLVLAGDWLDTGLNAGCIESAVMSGIQAANAVNGAALLDRVTGYHLPHRGRAGRPWDAPAAAAGRFVLSTRALGDEPDDIVEEGQRG